MLALSALFGRRRGIDNRLDGLRGELLSAQPRQGFLTGFASVLTFSPSSTRRRMASERGGLSSCFAAHLSTASRNSSDSLMAVTGSRPVAGRPPLFGFGSTVLDLGMFWYYHKSKPRGSSPEAKGLRPGLNWSIWTS